MFIYCSEVTTEILEYYAIEIESGSFSHATSVPDNHNPSQGITWLLLSSDSLWDTFWCAPLQYCTEFVFF